MTRSICFHLPQFHPIPENDEWWGKGFTEWRNTIRAQPRFKGHYQPHVPADLGFYDLRLAQVREQQAELARRYGVSGFCYYHYWFNGRRILEAPVDGILGSGEPDFPFMLCWANENWTRRWDGADREILISQDYGEEDDLDHIRHLATFFEDRRYIRKDGKPVFLVYKASDLPDCARTLDTWRHEYSRLGLGELFLCRVEAHGSDRADPRVAGFDAGIEFMPDWENQPPLIATNLLTKISRRVFGSSSGYRHNGVYDYAGMVEKALAKPPVVYPRFRCVTPSWDNSVRRAEGAVIYKDSTPAKFEYWMSETVRRCAGSEISDFVFVNAWNEWAEGAHLEPDERWGHAYLEAHRRSIGSDPELQVDLTAQRSKDKSWI